MSGVYPPEGDALSTRLAAAKAGQLIRTRLGLAVSKVRSGPTNLPFADLLPSPQLPAQPLQQPHEIEPCPSQGPSRKRSLGAGSGLGLGHGRPSQPAEPNESAPARPSSSSRPLGETTPKQTMYEMMLHPRMENVMDHHRTDEDEDQLDPSSLGGLGYGYPSGRASSGTNGTANYSAYRGVSSQHNRQHIPQHASSSSSFEQPYDSHNALSPSLYLASPDPGQGASAFFPSHSHFPQRPHTPSSSARDDTARNFDTLFPSASSGDHAGPSHGTLDPPYSPVRRALPGAKGPRHLAASPRGPGSVGGAFGRSPSATYASRTNGAGSAFSFAHNHSGSPGLAASPKMSSARTSMAPPRQPPIASPSGPLYPSHLSMGARDRLPSAGSSALAGLTGDGPRGHRRTVSSTLSAVINLQGARRANANPSPDRKRRLPSGGHFSPSSPDKKKARSLSYGSLPPPDLPLRRKPGASRLGGGGATADVAGLEESAASALASMLATHGKDGSEGSAGDGMSGSEPSHAPKGTPGSTPARQRGTGTPPPPTGEETDESAAGMLIFLHHSPSPAKTKSAAAARSSTGGSGTPGRGRVLMFDDHSPSNLNPSTTTSKPKPISKPSLNFPPAFITSPPTRPVSPIPLGRPPKPSASAPEGLVDDPSRLLSPVPTSSALSPRGPFFSPPTQPLGLLSAASSLDNVTLTDSETRRDDPEEILGSQKDPKDRRRPTSPSPTLARQPIPPGPTPSWPDFDFLTASSGDRTPTPPLSHSVELGEKMSGLA